jgi:hypothetical protein
MAEEEKGAVQHQEAYLVSEFNNEDCNIHYDIIAN